MSQILCLGEGRGGGLWSEFGVVLQASGENLVSTAPCDLDALLVCGGPASLHSGFCR